MSEIQKVCIFLPDNNKVEIPVQLKLTTTELRDIVSSHVNVQQRDYFGLAVYDEGDVRIWLMQDKRVLDNELPKTNGQIVLHYAVQFYVNSLQLLSDINAFEQFYLHARNLLFRGELECDDLTFFHFASLALQISSGDYTDDVTARAALKKLDAFPTRIFELHPSVEYCETQVLTAYRNLLGTTKGQGVMEFLSLVEKVPSYGTHFYSVKDKQEIVWWLGFNSTGIAQYDQQDRRNPRKLYLWSELGELSHSKLRINVEWTESKRRATTCGSSSAYSSCSTLFSNTAPSSTSDRRTGTVAVLVWYAATPHRAKCIANCGNEQRNFYLDRQPRLQRKSTSSTSSSAAVDPETVAYALTHRRHSFSKLNSIQTRGSAGPVTNHAATLHHSQMSHTNLESTTLCSTPAGSIRSLSVCSGDLDSSSDRSNLSANERHLSVEAARSMAVELLARQTQLMAALVEKETEMKKLMTEEFELTGVLPEGYRELATAGHPTQQLKETSFVLSPHLVRKASNLSPRRSGWEQAVSQLEMERAVLRNIYIVNEQKARQTRKKSYKIACKETMAKLMNVDEQLANLKDPASLYSSESSHTYTPSYSYLQRRRRPDGAARGVSASAVIIRGARGSTGGISSLVSLDEGEDEINLSRSAISGDDCYSVNSGGPGGSTEDSFEARRFFQSQSSLPDLLASPSHHPGTNSTSEPPAAGQGATLPRTAVNSLSLDYYRSPGDSGHMQHNSSAGDLQAEEARYRDSLSTAYSSTSRLSTASSSSGGGVLDMEEVGNDLTLSLAHASGKLHGRRPDSGRRTESRDTGLGPELASVTDSSGSRSGTLSRKDSLLSSRTKGGTLIRRHHSHQRDSTDTGNHSTVHKEMLGETGSTAHIIHRFRPVSGCCALDHRLSVSDTQLNALETESSGAADTCYWYTGGDLVPTSPQPYKYRPPASNQIESIGVENGRQMSGGVESNSGQQMVGSGGGAGAEEDEEEEERRAYLRELQMRSSVLFHRQSSLHSRAAAPLVKSYLPRGQT